MTERKEETVREKEREITGEKKRVETHSQKIGECRVQTRQIWQFEKAREFTSFTFTI